MELTVFHSFDHVNSGQILSRFKLKIAFAAEALQQLLCMSLGTFPLQIPFATEFVDNQQTNVLSGSHP